ncbi:DUF1116 domain-containing protein [Candidatus Bipolaricaulota bacterium]|nr:DUF1116 domain-containing protein [Candidatus Bipolaricaulota bacterium]
MRPGARFSQSSGDRIRDLFERELAVVNVGLEGFAEALRAERVPLIHVDWRPPAGGDRSLAERIDALAQPDGSGWIEEIATANSEAVARLVGAKPRIIGIGIAGDVIPGMRTNTVLHAGPPLEWEAMCGPMRGAVIGGLLYERKATSVAEADALAASGEILFSPCHHHQAVGPMAGIITASMPVWIIENEPFGNRAYCTLNEGLGKVLRYGAYGPEVIDRLDWMRDILAPILAATIERSGPIDLRSLIAQALQMGDEGHNRNRAGTSLLIRELAPILVVLDGPRESIAEILSFLHANDHFFLNLTMPAAKCALDAAAGISGSSLVTAMSRNGTEFGIRVSGTGDRWYTAPAPAVDGLYLPGFSKKDAALDIGDSAITETAGYGGFAMAAAPAIVQFVGGSPDRAIRTTQRMREICLADHPVYQIPALGFRGTPTGIDVLAVVSSGIVPAINTGIAHKEPGIGMVGAGLVSPPMACFAQAAEALAESIHPRDT